MLKQILKALGKTGKTAMDSVDKSLDFMDDIIESEPITNTIKKAKDLSGQAVEKAGELYEVSKQKAEEVMDRPEIKEFSEKIKDAAESTIEKTKEAGERILENEKVQETIDIVKEKTDSLASKLEDTMDSTFGSEEE